MSIATRYGVGTLVAGEGCLELRPKIRAAASAGVMFVHGAGSNATYCTAAYGRQGGLTKAVIDSGRVGLACDNGGPQTWGNATAMARMTAAYNYLQTLGVAPGKVALVSGSMGGLVSLNWAVANPSKVACIVSVIPVVSPTDIVANNRQGYASTVNGAFSGGWSEATYGATSNPRTMANAGKFAGIPMLIFYGLTDSLCVPAQTEAFAAAVGSSVDLVPLPTGHEEATYAATDHPRVVQFLRDHT